MRRLGVSKGVKQLGANAVLAVPSRRVRNVFVRSVLGWPADVQVGRKVRLQSVSGAKVGVRVVIHRRCRLDLRGGVVIGDDVAISPDVEILTADHDPQSPTRAYRERPVRIGDRAWIATGATLLPGTTVGEGCVVGGKAVAAGALEPWSLYTGNPARRRGDRSPQAQARLAGTMKRFE